MLQQNKSYGKQFWIILLNLLFSAGKEKVAVVVSLLLLFVWLLAVEPEG